MGHHAKLPKEFTMAATITPTEIVRKQYPSRSSTSNPRAGTDRAAQDHDLTLAYQLSSPLAVVATIATAIGVFHVGIFRDTAMTAGNARGTALVILAIAIPTMIASMILVSRGSLRAHIVWLGALTYIAYNSVFFSYAIHFNSLFLLYAGTLSLSIWSIVALLRGTDVEEIRAHFSSSTPIRTVASYLVITTIFFALVWLKDIVPATLHNSAPAGLAGTGMVTNSVHMTDFSVMFPLTILAAMWLWQRRALGYLLAGVFLVYGVLEAVSVATDQAAGHISDPKQSLAVLPLFAVLALVGMVPTVIFFRNLRPARNPSRQR
jgi:hypothetical protein